MTAAAPAQGTPIIDMRGGHLTLGDERAPTQVPSGLGLQVDEGSFTAAVAVGRSGCGRTWDLPAFDPGTGVPRRRSHRDPPPDPGPGPTVVTGRNEPGKSSFADVVYRALIADTELAGQPAAPAAA